MKFLRICFAFICLQNFAFAQNYDLSFGVAIDFGNTVKRIGLRCSANYRYNFFQANSTLNLYYNVSSLGTGLKSPELQYGLAANFGFGKQNAEENYFLGLIENNLPHRNAIGYAYTIYLDRQETSQTTGMFFGNFGNFGIATENDLLGGGKGWKDRFRTGAIQVSYRFEYTKLALNSVMWTGDYSTCNKVKNSAYPARFGYKSSQGSIYGNKSLGLLSVSVSQVLPYQQYAELDMGINSEYIRHSIQNKALHDMPFYTDGMVKRKLMHIPMLQADGSQYLYQTGQAVKPAQFYYNLGINSAVFY